MSVCSRVSVCSRGGLRSLVLVVFIGGVTSAEIAALRFLSAQVNIGKIISIFFQIFIANGLQGVINLEYFVRK
jgi:phage-related holin